MEGKVLAFPLYKGTVLRHVPHGFLDVPREIEVLLPTMVAGLLTCLLLVPFLPLFNFSTSLLGCLGSHLK